MTRVEKSAAEKRSLPVWLAYTLLALLWPLWVEIFVVLTVFSQYAVSLVAPPSTALPVGIGIAIVASAAASCWLGSALSRQLPRLIWIVPVIWLALAAVIAVTALGISDVRSPLGPIGVLGPFLFSAIGFVTGARRHR